MDSISNFCMFVYGDIDKDFVTGSAICIAKALGLTVLFCGGSVIGSYLIVTLAFLICCITILPIILISVYWDGFWGDLGYTYKWLWIAGFIIGGCISGLLFLPVWIYIAILLVLLALSLASSLVLFALAFVFGILFGIGYLMTCCCCCTDIFSEEDEKSTVAPHPESEIEIEIEIPETKPVKKVVKIPERIPKPVVLEPSKSAPAELPSFKLPPTKLPPVELPPINSSTIIFESTLNDKDD